MAKVFRMGRPTYKNGHKITFWGDWCSNIEDLLIKNSDYITKQLDRLGGDDAVLCIYIQRCKNDENEEPA